MLSAFYSKCDADCKACVSDPILTPEWTRATERSDGFVKDPRDKPGGGSALTYKTHEDAGPDSSKGNKAHARNIDERPGVELELAEQSREHGQVGECNQCVPYPRMI